MKPNRPHVVPYGTDSDIPPMRSAPTSKFSKYSKIIQVNKETPIPTREPMETDPRKHFMSRTKDDFKKFEIEFRGGSESHRADEQRSHSTLLATSKLPPPSTPTSEIVLLKARNRSPNHRSLEKLRTFVSDKIGTKADIRPSWH